MSQYQESRDLCTKYELDMPPNNEVIKMYSCCHGNKISLATRNIKGWYWQWESVYQIWPGYSFKQPSYKDFFCHGNKVSLANIQKFCRLVLTLGTCMPKLGLKWCQTTKIQRYVFGNFVTLITSQWHNFTPCRKMIELFRFSISFYPRIDYFRVKIKFSIFHHFFHPGLKLGHRPGKG